MSVTRVRALQPDELDAARALLSSTVEQRRYLEKALEVLPLAVQGSAEYEALVAERGGAVVGVAVYGLVSGAAGAGALHALVVADAARRHGVASELVEHVRRALAERGARFVLVELADDPALAGLRRLLDARGFVEESRVADFYRDGVALVFLRCELDAASAPRPAR